MKIILYYGLLLNDCFLHQVIIGIGAAAKMCKSHNASLLEDSIRDLRLDFKNTTSLSEGPGYWPPNQGAVWDIRKRSIVLKTI